MAAGVKRAVITSSMLALVSVTDPSLFDSGRSVTEDGTRLDVTVI